MQLMLIYFEKILLKYSLFIGDHMQLSVQAEEVWKDFSFESLPTLQIKVEIKFLL